MDFTYTVIKSNRKSYSIRITNDNKIVVRVPLKASQCDIDKLIESKRQWINKILSSNNSNMLDCDDIREMRSAYVNGNKVPVTFDKHNFIDENGVHIINANGFKNAYVKSLSEEFLSRFRDAEADCNLHANAVNFRSYKSRWGCCDGEHNITFNFRIMMLPVSLQYYVMVHELCHTVYMNHSKQYWALVKLFVPDYLKLRRQLKNYNFIVNLY